MGRSSRIRCEHQKHCPFPASANKQLQATFPVLSQAHILANTALLAWVIPDPAHESPRGLGIGVGLRPGCAFSAAQRAAFIILKSVVLIFEQETVTLGLLSSGSLFPCQSFGLTCLKKQEVLQSPRLIKTLQPSACLLLPSKIQCGLFIAGSGRKASLFLCLCGVCGTRLCQTTRQRQAIIELGEKINESRGICV